MNTNSSGSNSLPDALSSGSRIIVFTTGGTLNYAGELVVPANTTIFGQTAPGGGFQLANTTLKVSNSNVIVQHLRIRVGDNSTNSLSAEARDAITIGNPSTPVRNVIIDHCSAEWAIDECIGIAEGSTVVTVSWSIIAEGYNKSIHPEGNHSKGLMSHNQNGDSITFSHNLIAHNLDRNPNLVNVGVIDCINNVAYGYEFPARFGNPTGSGTKLHFIGNRYKPGPSTTPNTYILISDDPGASKAFVFGNIGYNRLSDTNPNQWAITTLNESTTRSLDYFTNINVTSQDVDSIYNLVLNRAGPFPRDAVDLRIISEVRDSTGSVKNGRANQVIFYPVGTSTISSTATTVEIRVAETVPADRWAVLGSEDSIEITGGTGFPQNVSNIKKITDNTLANGDGDPPTSILTIDGSFSPLLGTDTDWRIREVPPSPYSGDYPTLAAGTPQTDSDSDGVPDIWEVFMGTDPGVADATGDVDNDGYKNVEEYAEYVLELLTSGLPAEPRYLLR
jgi:hypothetical protein